MTKTLFVIDVGNTQSVLGVFTDERLLVNWRTQTHPRRTSDEYGILIRHLFETASLEHESVTDVIISCVVPTMQRMLSEMVERYFGLEPMMVGNHLDIGMPILIDNPGEVGADRIVNSVAGFAKHKCGLIIVDFGTATTFDVVSPDGEYIGGSIAPGLNVSAEALFLAASKLPRVEVVRPEKAIGVSTVSGMQSGLYFGYVGLVKEVVARLASEVPFEAKVIATGGIAHILASDVGVIVEVDPFLTLEGLRILHERNTLPG